MERKLAAILAADVVGYSRLMEADEAGTFARVKDRRKTLLEPELEAMCSISAASGYEHAIQICCSAAPSAHWVAWR